MTDEERTEIQQKINRYDWLTRKMSAICKQRELLKVGKVIIDNPYEGAYIKFELSEKSMEQLKTIIDEFLETEIKKYEKEIEDL